MEKMPKANSISGKKKVHGGRELTVYDKNGCQNIPKQLESRGQQCLDKDITGCLEKSYTRGNERECYIGEPTHLPIFLLLGN